MTPINKQPISVPDAIEYPTKEILDALSGNEFRNPRDEILWKGRPLSVPAGTHVSFLEHSNPEKGQVLTCTVHLERIGYFKLDFEVQPGPGMNNQLPAGFTTQVVQGTSTFVVNIAMKYAIQRRKDRGFQPERYATWADALFSGLKESMGFGPVSASRKPLYEVGPGPTEAPRFSADASVVVTPASANTGAKMGSFNTTGMGEYELDILNVSAEKLEFDPPGIAVSRKSLPVDLKIDDHKTVTVVRFTDKGFVIDDHRWPGIHFSVALISAHPRAGEPPAASQIAGPVQKVEISAPNGIAISGGIVNNPTVNNLGPPPLPTPTVKVCASYNDPRASGEQYQTVITLRTDVQIVRPWFVFYFDGPVLEGTAGMSDKGFFGFTHGRADKMPNPERSFLLRLDTINMSSNIWFPHDGTIQVTVPSAGRVRIINVLSGGGDDPDVPFPEHLLFGCE